MVGSVCTPTSILRAGLALVLSTEPAGHRLCPQSEDAHLPVQPRTAGEPATACRKPSVFADRADHRRLHLAGDRRRAGALRRRSFHRLRHGQFRADRQLHHRPCAPDATGRCGFGPARACIATRAASSGRSVRAVRSASIPRRCSKTARARSGAAPSAASTSTRRTASAGITPSTPAPSTQLVTSLHREQRRQHSHWTTRGLKQFRGGTMTAASDTDAVGACPLRALHVDREGSFWIGGRRRPGPSIRATVSSASPRLRGYRRPMSTVILQDKDGEHLVRHRRRRHRPARRRPRRNPDDGERVSRGSRAVDVRGSGGWSLGRHGRERRDPVSRRLRDDVRAASRRAQGRGPGAAAGSVRPLLRRSRGRRPRRPRRRRHVHHRSGPRPAERGQHPGVVRRRRAGRPDRLERRTLPFSRRRADAWCPTNRACPRRTFAACCGIGRAVSGSAPFAASRASMTRDARAGQIGVGRRRVLHHVALSGSARDGVGRGDGRRAQSGQGDTLLPYAWPGESEPPHDVRAITPGPAGSMWLSTAATVWRLRGNTAMPFDRAQRPPERQGVRDPRRRARHVVDDVEQGSARRQDRRSRRRLPTAASPCCRRACSAHFGRDGQRRVHAGRPRRRAARRRDGVVLHDRGRRSRRPGASPAQPAPAAGPRGGRHRRRPAVRRPPTD